MTCDICYGTGYTWDGQICTSCPEGRNLDEAATEAADARRDAFNDWLDEQPDCPTCGGTGQVARYQFCPDCGGTGKQTN